MDEFFRAYRATEMKIPTYFIESTAPNNVDDEEGSPPDLPAELKLRKVDSEEAIEEIAKILATEPEPNLVIMVHGFNNPRLDAVKTYAAAARAIGNDDAILKRPRGLVCVGYRWPSENMGQPWRGTWDALPTLPSWILYLGLILFLLSFPLFYWASDIKEWWSEALGYVWNPFGVHVVTLLGWTIAGLVLALALLRAIVYFRDNYRASNYGVPDLIQIIRAIDGKVADLRGPRGARAAHDNTVQLSFIGHSMGGFVVTNAIRTLSDLFATRVLSLNSYGARASADREGEPLSQNIGESFRLMRFVLASPDIPAEALLSNRGNFLRSALERFEEAYLFSNEGDAVLRQISTLANYFVFPTKSKYHGFRLGNVEILAKEFGLIERKENEFLSALRIGHSTLQELYDALEHADAERRKAEPAPPAPPAQILLPKVFTYFDCTDYKDLDIEHVERPLLTFAKCLKVSDATARLRWYSHQRLLWAYLIWGRPNVHGGYFEGTLSQTLIYRLACLGFDGTVKAFTDLESMGAECRAKQIRVLLSPKLAGAVKAAAGPLS